MSKNLRGFASGSSVKIDLLDIDANSVTATTGTFTDIIATNYSINNVILSNLIVSGVVRFTGITSSTPDIFDEFEILIRDPASGTIYKFPTLVFNTGAGVLKTPTLIANIVTVADLFVTGTLNLTGSMPSLTVTGQTDLGTGLSIQSMASVGTNAIHALVLWDSTTVNICQDILKLYYDSTNITLYSPNISVMGQTDTDTLSIQSLTPVASGLNIAYGITLWNSTTTDLSHDITKLYYNKANETLYSPNISVTNFNIIPVTRNDNQNYPVIFYDDNDEKLAIDGSTTNTITYNPFSNRLTCIEIKATSELRSEDRLRVGGSVVFENLDIVLSNKLYSIVLSENVGGDVAGDSSKLYYDTADDTLYSPNVNISTTLTVNCPNTSQVHNNRLAFIEAFDDGVNPIDYSKGVLSKSGDLYFNQANQTLFAENMRVGGNFNCNGQAFFGANCTIESSHDLKFLELDATATGEKGIIFSQNIGRIIFRRSSTLEPVMQIVNEVARTITGSYQIELSTDNIELNCRTSGFIRNRVNNVVKTTLSNSSFTVDTDLIVTCPPTTEVRNNRIPFVEYKAGATDQTTGILSSSGSLFYNHSSETLVGDRIYGETLVYSPRLRVIDSASALPHGEFTLNATDGVQLIHPTGFAIKVNSVKQLQVETTDTTISNDLKCESDLTVDGVCDFQNATATALTTTALTTTALTVTSGAGSNGNCTLTIVSDTDNLVETACPQINMKKDGNRCGYFIKGGTDADSSATSTENNLIFNIADTTATPNAFYFQEDTTELLKIATGGSELSTDLNIVGDLDAQSTTVRGIQVTTSSIIFDDVAYSGINGQLPLLFWDNRSNGDNRLRQRDTDLTYNAGQQRLTTTNAEVTGVLTYGGLPLNYVQSVEGGANGFVCESNMWGKGASDKMIVFSSVAANYEMRSFGADLTAWDKSAFSLFSLSNVAYQGLWRWSITIDIQYNTGNTNARLNPKFYVERTRVSGPITKVEKVFGSLGQGRGMYFRGGNRARNVTICGQGVVDCLSVDTYKIKTQCNLGQNVGFNNNTTAFEEKGYTIEWQYLGPSTSVYSRVW